MDRVGNRGPGKRVIDDDVTERARTFIREAHAAGKPFFVWWNATHMHLWTRIPEEAEGISGQGFYNDAMVLHDRNVGQMLDLLDELGIAEDTLVLYGTDEQIDVAISYMEQVLERNPDNAHARKSVTRILVTPL